MQEAPAHIVSIAGGVAGIAEVITVQPLDMVKTRNQLNRSPFRPSLIVSILSVYNEGGLFRFYRGLLPELIGFIPKSTAQFFSYEYSRRYLCTEWNHGQCHWSICSLSGYIAGHFTALTVTPSQIIKVRLQSKEHLGKYRNSLDCYYRVIAEEGIGSLMIGLGATIWRNCTWNTIYFGLMYYIKEEILPEVDEKHSALSLSQTLLSGFIGGCVATCFNAPFDVVKSRVQQQHYTRFDERRWTLMILTDIWRMEGIGGLYRGIQPKILRMGIGGAVSMMSFEFICNAFVHHQSKRKGLGEDVII